MDLRPTMVLAAVLFLQFDHFVEIPNEFLIAIVEIAQIFQMRPEIPVRLSDRLIQNEAQQLTQHLVVEIHQFAILDSIVQTNERSRRDWWSEARGLTSSTVRPNRHSTSSVHRWVWNVRWCSTDRHRRSTAGDCWGWFEQWEDRWVLSTWRSPGNKLGLRVPRVQHWPSTTSHPRGSHRRWYFHWTSKGNPSSRSRADWNHALRHANGLEKESIAHTSRTVVFTWNLHWEISIGEDFEGRRVKWTDRDWGLTKATVRIDNLSIQKRAVFIGSVKSSISITLRKGLSVFTCTAALSRNWKLVVFLSWCHFARSYFCPFRFRLHQASIGTSDPI